MSDGISDGYRQTKMLTTENMPEGWSEFRCFECWSGNGHCTTFQPSICEPMSADSKRCPLYRGTRQYWQEAKE